MKKQWLYLDIDNDFQNELSISDKVNIPLENFIFKLEKKAKQFKTNDLKWNNLLCSLVDLIRSDLPPLLSLATWRLTDELKDYYLAIDKDGKVFVDSFFFHSITSNTKEEIIAYLVYICISLNQLLSDLEIECFQLERQFLETRKKDFSDREYTVLYQDIMNNKKSRQIHLLALIFLNRIHYDHFTKVSFLEKGIIREKVGNREVKDILGLGDGDYEYMEKAILPPEQMEQAEKIADVVDREQISIEDYVSTHLRNKKILLWNWWAVSPFLIKDISFLLSLLSQYKTIKKIYIDLPRGMNSEVQGYLSNKLEEERLESLIKQVYPSFLKDYHKEVAPYLIFLDRIKTLYSGHFTKDKLQGNKKTNDFLDCFGLTAEEILDYLPLVNKESQIYFEIEENWHQLFLKEWQECHSYRDYEIVIFVQALKPMFYLPNYFHHLPENNFLERLIHADKFTGFGPKRPANFLALYSQYHGYRKNSFVLPRLKDYFFVDDIILPLNDHRQSKIDAEQKNKTENLKNTSIPMVLDDSKFNCFNLYDTVLYSNQYNNGFSSGVEIDLKKDLVFS